MRSFIAALILALWTPARGQPLDCQALLHGTMPFEARMSNSNGRLYKVQVLREEGLRRLQYTERPDGEPVRATFEATFIKSTRRPGGKVVDAVWSVPTDRYFWDRGIAAANYRFSDEDGRHVATYAVLGEATEHVGSCDVRVKHYSAILQHSKVQITTEVWFSTELRLPIRSIDVSDVSGVKHALSSRVEDIRLDFEAMR